MNNRKKILIVYDALCAGNSLDFLFDDQPHCSPAEILADIKAIEEILSGFGYAVAIFDIRGSLLKVAEGIRTHNPDMIFNLCESIGNDPMGEVRAACLYELLDIPYTGSDPYTLSVAGNKARAKEIMNFYKITTPKYFVIKKPSDLECVEKLDFPLIVKPLVEDGSIGIDERSLVYNKQDLKSALERLQKNFRSAAIVEEFVEGREFQAAVLGNKKLEILPISEVNFSMLPSKYPRILSYNAKWESGSEVYRGTPIICPAEIPADLEKSIKDVAFQVYRIFECRDYARIDFRLDAEGRLHVLEINPNPDITLEGGLERAAAVSGMDYSQLIKKIVEGVLERIVN